jgi:hypothetical protein
MQRPILMTALLVGALALPLTSAVAASVMFSGTQSNANAPAGPGAGCPVLKVNIGNPGSGPFFSTGSSNLGGFTTTQSHCLDGGPPTMLSSAPVPYYDGQFTYLFTDGDTLTGSYIGTLTNGGALGLVDNLQTFTIAGGTGEFAGATGTFIGTGKIQFPTGPAAPGAPPVVPVSQITFSGVINAPAVPEPATWAMLIAGLGGVGGLLRRRRARPAFAAA